MPHSHAVLTQNLYLLEKPNSAQWEILMIQKLMIIIERRLRSETQEPDAPSIRSSYFYALLIIEWG